MGAGDSEICRGRSRKRKGEEDVVDECKGTGFCVKCGGGRTGESENGPGVAWRMFSKGTSVPSIRCVLMNEEFCN